MPGFMGQGKVQFFNSDGSMLVGGQVWILEANSSGFSNLVDSYDDYDNAINQVDPQPNPVPLNSRGEAIIILNEEVKLVVEGTPIIAGHGPVIWTLEEFAVANAQETSSGGYKFLNNTIADNDDNIVAVLATETGANSYLGLNAFNSNDPPMLNAINSGVTDLDLIVKPQNAGAVVLINKARVRASNAASTNSILLSSASAVGTPSITTEGTGTNIDLLVDLKGTGALNVTAPTNITGATAINGATAITGVLTQVGNVGITGAATVSGLTTTGTLATGNTGITGTLSVSGISNLGTVNAGVILGSSTVTATGNLVGSDLVLVDSGFGYTLACPALSSSKNFTLPATDGSSGQALVTNGSGVLSFATPGAVNRYAKIYGSSTPVSSGNITKVVLNGASGGNIDPYSLLDDANDRIIPNIAGAYMLTATIGFNVVIGAGSEFGGQFRKNGSTISSNTGYWGYSNLLYGNIGGNTILTANGTTDYFELWIDNSLGANTVTINAFTQLCITYIGP